jgi:hypothetical protein
MTRRRLSILLLALLGTVGVLAFPGEGRALSAEFIDLTATGPSPAVLTIGADEHPVWLNQDTVAHTVTFASGCSIEVAPGGYGQCTGGAPSGVVGNYAYTVDGTTQASVNIVALSRAVTLTAKRHRFRLGSKVRLHGTLSIAQQSPPTLFGPRMPVTVLARPNRHHPWYRLAVVTARPLKAPVTQGNPHSVWQLWVRPHAGTTYRVVANTQPRAGKYWENARSEAYRLLVRHRTRSHATKR